MFLVELISSDRFGEVLFDFSTELRKNRLSFARNIYATSPIVVAAKMFAIVPVIISINSSLPIYDISPV